MKSNIVLTGFMGTGKSSAGRRLARMLNMDYVDMDREIEKLLGMSIARIFAIHGEVRFRSEETLMARKLAARTNTVISTGGGVVLKPENMQVLRETGVIVCLQASPEVILERVSSNRNRPLLSRPDVETVRVKLRERQAFYAQADITVDSSEGTAQDTADRILEELKQYRQQEQGEQRS